jgi:DNA-binding Lrp family transcriptional regulator
MLKAIVLIMENIYRITDSEKKLLHAIGNYPDISMKELLNYTTYKWETTVVRKLEQLKEQEILVGPVYVINHGKLCRNTLYKVVCMLETHQQLETVTSYLKLIESLLWTFPVMSYKKVLQVGFFSSDNTKMKALLQLLKDNNIITDYVMRTCRHKRIVENPNLFGDFNPSLDHLLQPCDIPDMSREHYDTTWNECDISILPYLRVGRKGAKLIEILREEKRLHSRRWTYEEIRYSRDKMIRNGLIEKVYVFYPFPFRECTQLHLFLKTEDIMMTRRIMHNFARGERVYKEYSLYEDWGLLICTCHPLFLADVIGKLDSIDHIKEKELYQLRSNSGKYYFGQPPQLQHYDFDKQTLEYPYHVFEEKIKEKLERG